MAEMKDYSENNFHEVEWEEGISVVRFHAPWCPPCRSSSDVFEKFAEGLDASVHAGRVNTDTAPALAVRYEIWGLPTVIMFRDGQEVKRINGVKSLSVYRNAFEKI
ncbi:thioredoxin fold domain-containing protein [Escherichia coli]|uniref:Thioredoxin n=1 Tax=Escherichia coli TaxID=562 RepID=A0A8H9SP06_ECOLX|nr:thioredoxin domain-containing protein [Escherichia coli]EFF1411240.1 thiol reductase thioredoxin [Escherichia coli]EFH6259195.1 thiol reductase thioredoxin [Escherichia coli]EFK6266643.1 thiol reductase thioredoxin [Escherichia coli]EGG1131871.1 thiol reductase thioredoxin [Escherichia coli]EHP6371297.1 thioredoxin fold domain-containing protein [Escherichia coli]